MKSKELRYEDLLAFEWCDDKCGLKHYHPSDDLECHVYGETNQ